ncbi:MAG: hypothetical protein ACFFBD_25875, partial [Candidatus Hodarchaeota archaeon]
ALFYKTNPLKDYWTLSEHLSVIAFAIILASTFSFLTLIGITILVHFTAGGNEISISGQLLLGWLLLFQLAILIIYPIFEFVFFSNEGKQATETYHKRIESIIDDIAKAIGKFKLPRALSGVIWYVIIFGGSGVITYLILLYLGDMHLRFTALLFLFMLYPTLILGYYAARGVYEAIRPVIYLQENYQLRLRDRETWKNGDNWLAFLEFGRSFYGVIAALTGIAFIPGIKIVWEFLLNTFILFWAPWLEVWRPLLAILVY